MSLRALFLLLLFANLAFLAWANLIDVPPEPPHNDSISHLPQLQLLNEARGKAAPTAPSAPSSAAPTTGAPSSGTGASSSTAPSTTAPSPSPSATGTSTNAPSAISPGRAPAATADSVATHPAVASGVVAASGRATASGQEADHRCITVGPFTDPEQAIVAADLLRDRGFAPRQRTEASPPPQGYWVFIGGLKSAAEETSVVQRLERAGISDAKAMPAAEGARRVSVGLFTASDGAERRARAVRRLGFDAKIEPRQAAASHWVDVNLDSSGQSLPAEGLLSLQEGGARLEIKACSAAGAGDGRNGNSAPASGAKGSAADPTPPGSKPGLKSGVPRPLTAKGAARPG